MSRLFVVILVLLCILVPVLSFKLSKSSFTGLKVGSNRGGIVPPYRGDSHLFNSNYDENNSTGSSKDLKGDKDDKSSSPIEKFWKNLSPDFKEDVKTTTFALIFAILLRIFIIEPRYIPSLSMFPTFDIGDQLIVDKVSKFGRQYQRRDVVVFNPPEAYIDMTGNTEALIKRIVAVGGDTVEVINRKVYVNGVEQKEEYINEDPEYSLQPLQVPQGFVLVLGDNRNKSFDSHVWGYLPEKNIIGRAVLKYWPPWRAGFVEGSN